jgi:hypothetical protein
MDKKHLMGQGDAIVRRHVTGMLPTEISGVWRRGLLKSAIAYACEALAAELDVADAPRDLDELVKSYEQTMDRAVGLGLFQRGGIREKDHLMLWCLAQMLQPELYIESGVFIGSSLHAVASTPSVKEVVAIDPNLTRLLVPRTDIPGGRFIDQQDFSELSLDCRGRRALAYFDDHINTADRILQACDKGITQVVFDDSTGMEGICQRLYPALPTLPMIMRPDLLVPGAELAWTFKRSSLGGLTGVVKQAMWKAIGRGYVRLSFTVTDDLVEQCRAAKSRIRKCINLPNLADFVPQIRPSESIDIAKFFVLLDSAS